MVINKLIFNVKNDSNNINNINKTWRMNKSRGMLLIMSVRRLFEIARLAHILFWEEGKDLFNDAVNTFYLRLYGVGHMVKDHSDSERGNPLPPHGLPFLISSKGSFICIIPQTG